MESEILYSTNQRYYTAHFEYCKNKQKLLFYKIKLYEISKEPEALVFIIKSTSILGIAFNSISAFYLDL